MNFNRVKWALGQLPKMGTAGEKLVLINLAGRFNEEKKYAWPGVDLIAADLGIEKRTVTRSLTALVKIGILRIQRRDHLKLSSLYFLDFDFNRAGVDKTQAPEAKKTIGGVTKSQIAGDKKSFGRVTESHPNKQKDNKLLKKQQQPVVVFEKLFWEKPLTAEEKAACEFLLAAAQLPLETCQKFADEMAGDGRRAPIRNPVGWLKNMIDRYGREGFSFAYSAQVAAGRAGRAAQAERENLALPPRSAVPARLALSHTGRAELAKMGRHPKPAPPQVEATHASANLADAACKSAIAVANLSGEATPAN